MKWKSQRLMSFGIVKVDEADRIRRVKAVFIARNGQPRKG